MFKKYILKKYFSRIFRKMQLQHQNNGLLTAPYVKQKLLWPQEGNHIMGQYDEKSIIVYQAYSPQIAKAIIQSQNYHSELCQKNGFSLSRMTWIKPNFLWMMYRSGWATKQNQQKILAIRLSIPGFEYILSHAVLSKHNETTNQKPSKDDKVRLQWDPDHNPDGSKHPLRKAIQLGLRSEVLKKISEEFIVGIDDITEFVEENRKFVSDEQKLIVPVQRIYKVADQNVAKAINVSKP